MYILSLLVVLVLLAVLGTAVLGLVLETDEPELGLGTVTGLLLHAYLLYLLGCAGLLDNGSGSAVLVLLLLAAGVLAAGGRPWWRSALRRLDAGHLIGFGSVLALLLGYAWIRARNPQIWGEEKFMDFLFLNGIWRSEAFPPNDPWFAGEPINYYYFGYLMVADLAHLSATPPAVMYNLALGLLFGLSFAGAFAVTRLLTRSVRHGLLGGLLLAVCGNLEGALQVLNGHVRDFNYFQSSRIVEFTINEFPFFSFIHADLHPHVMSIPVLLLLLYVLARAAQNPALLVGPSLREPAYLGRLGLLALLLGALPATNMADLPTFYGIALLVFLLVAARTPAVPAAGLARLRGAAPGLVALGAVFVFGYLLFLPFHAHFESAQVKIGWNAAEGKLEGVGWVRKRTGFVEFLVVHALFVYVLATDLLSRPGPLDPGRPARQREPYVVALGALGVVTLLLLDSLMGAVLVLLLGALFLALLRRDAAPEPAEQFTGVLVLAAFGLLLGCELVFIRDFYGGDYERQNTVFKFYYHAWILLSLATPVSLRALAARFPDASLRGAWTAGFGLLLAACLVYPVMGTYARYFRDEPVGTLYGMEHIARWHPAEHEAMLYLQQNAPRDARLLELPGPPYQYYGRFAANTGIPTVLGWVQHEAFWRDNTYKLPRAREQDVRHIYQAQQLDDGVRGLLDRYAIRYIVVGELERKDIPAAALAKFEALPVAFRKDDVTIYEWKPSG